jgi:sulfide:quinone oxidoreductase
LLASDLRGDVQVTLIDKSDSFIFGFSKFDILLGKRSTDEVRMPYDSPIPVARKRPM